MLNVDCPTCKKGAWTPESPDRPSVVRAAA